MEDYYPPTIMDGIEMTPESVWLLSVTSLMILAFFVVAAVIIYRKYGGESQRGLNVPPIPQRVEYDSSLTPDERRLELELMEDLMRAPAYGELPSRDEKSAGETER